MCSCRITGFFVKLQRPELFTTNELGSTGWMTETDRLEIKMMYGCVGVPGRLTVL